MKEKIFNGMIIFIKKNKPEITDEELEIIEYGLDSLYLTFTKIVIIFLLSYFLGIIKETLYTLFFYNLIRFFAFGLHAEKSSHCLFFSLLCFTIIPYIVSIVKINSFIKIIGGFVAFVLVSMYAPADTKKRPLINKSKRIRFKVLSIIFSFILLCLIIYYRDEAISSYMFIGFIFSCIVILPITYKLFDLPYNNYKTYKEV